MLRLVLFLAALLLLPVSSDAVLFSHAGSAPPPVINITGISTSPTTCTGASGAAQGSLGCTLTATSSGGALTGVTYTYTNNLGNEFQIGGGSSNQLQAGAGTFPAGSGTPYQPTITVHATNNANGNQTYAVPITITSTIGLATPVTCTAIATGCAGTVGDTAGTSIGTLVPTQTGGSAGAITCNTTMPNSQGNRFAITSGCILQTGSVAYSAGSYTVTVAFSGASASANPYNLSFTVTINSGGGVSLVQQRIINNLSGGATTTSILDTAVQFADGQVPAGDSVLAKTGAGANMTLQADNCSFYVSGALKQCSMKVQYPAGLANNATDAIGFYDNPSSSFNTTCYTALSNVVNTLTVSHDYRVTTTIGAQLYTFSVNNEFANEASTHALVYSTGPNMCSYKVYGELRAGTTFGSTAQGQIWAMLYIDSRSDGTIRINGSVIGCRPLKPAGTTTTACPLVTLAPDSNGNVIALSDYISGSQVVLVGCATNGCVIGGNGTGGGFNIYAGYEDFFLGPNAWGYDTGPDIHNIVPAYPNCLQANPETCGVITSRMVAPGIFSTANEKTYIAAHPLTSVGTYAPLWCSSVVGPAQCHYGTTGAHIYVGYQTGMWMRCYIAGATSVGATECLNERLAATMSGSVEMQWRDANTGSPPNMTTFFTAPAGTSGIIPQLKDAHAVSWGAAPTMTGVGLGPTGHGEANNHAPNHWMGSCLLWGEQWMCDRVIDQWVYDTGVQNPGYRNPIAANGPNGHAYGGLNAVNPQMRQMAWADRNESNALAVSPDNLTDGTTTIANPVKAMLKIAATCANYVASGTACATVDGGSGQLAYLADFLTAPWYEAGQSAIGWFWSGNAAHNGQTYPTVGPPQLPHADVWQNSYSTLSWSMRVLRGEMASNHPVITKWADLHMMGMSVNGCPANAPYAYNYSVTKLSSGVFDTNQASTNLAQSWSDVFSGTVESGNTPIAIGGEPLMSFASGQVPGPGGTSTINIVFSKPSSVSQAQFESFGVGMQFAFVVSGYTQPGGFAVPHQTLVSSVTHTSTTTDTVVLNKSITGPAAASFTASITGTVMTVTAVASGTITIGGQPVGAGVNANTSISNQLTGTTGGVGTYTIGPSQTVVSEAMTANALPTNTSQFTFMQWNGGDSPVSIDPNTGAQVPMVPGGGCPSTIASPHPNLALTTAQINGGNLNYLVGYNAAAIALAETGNANAISVRDYWYNDVANASVDACAAVGSGTWDTNTLWPPRLTSSTNGWMVDYAPFNIVAPVCRP